MEVSTLAFRVCSFCLFGNRSHVLGGETCEGVERVFVGVFADRVSFDGGDSHVFCGNSHD